MLLSLIQGHPLLNSKVSFIQVLHFPGWRPPRDWSRKNVRIFKVPLAAPFSVYIHAHTTTGREILTRKDIISYTQNEASHKKELYHLGLMFHFLRYFSAFTVLICLQLIPFSQFSLHFLFYHLSHFYIFYYWFSTLITTTTVHFIFSHTAGEISSLTTMNLHWWQTQWTTTDSRPFISFYNQPVWNKYKCTRTKQAKHSYHRLITASILTFTSLSGFYFLLAKKKNHYNMSNASDQSPESNHLTAPIFSCFYFCHFSVVELVCFELISLMNSSSK